MVKGGSRNATAPAPSGGRRRLAAITRKLLWGDDDIDGDFGDDGDQDHHDEDHDGIRPPRPKHDGPWVTSQTQYLTKLCPASGNAPYDNVVDSAGNPLYGQLVVDNGICGAGNATDTSLVSDRVDLIRPRANGLHVCRVQNRLLIPWAPGAVHGWLKPPDLRYTSNNYGRHNTWLFDKFASTLSAYGLVLCLLPEKNMAEQWQESIRGSYSFADSLTLRVRLVLLPGLSGLATHHGQLCPCNAGCRCMGVLYRI